MVVDVWIVWLMCVEYFCLVVLEIDKLVLIENYTRRKDVQKDCGDVLVVSFCTSFIQVL